MKASIENISPVKRCITVEVPPELQEKARRTAMDKIRSEANLPGFRKGKVPDNLISSRFPNEIKVETIKEMVRLTYPQAVQEVGAKPLGDPRIVPKGELIVGAPFTYKANIEIYPEVTATGYDGLELEREPVSVTKEEVETELVNLQHQMTQLEPAPEGKIEAGMVAMVDFKGTAGGKPFPGSEAENYVVDFGSGALLKDFEVQIEGLKAKDEKDVTFHYPADYFKSTIAGKKGEFRVKVKEVRRKVVPKLDDEFAKSLGDYKNLDEVRTELEKRIANYKEHLVRNQLKEQTVRQLIERHKELEAPLALVDAELGNMLDQLKRHLDMRGQTFEDAKVNAKEFVSANVGEATNRARGYMLVSAIARQETIDVTNEEIDKKIKEIATANRQSVDNVKKHFEKEKLLGQLRSQLVFEKTLDFILSKAKIKVKKPKKEKKK